MSYFFAPEQRAVVEDAAWIACETLGVDDAAVLSGAEGVIRPLLADHAVCQPAENFIVLVDRTFDENPENILWVSKLRSRHSVHGIHLQMTFWSTVAGQVV